MNILKELNACQSAIYYAESKPSLEQAWNDCNRGDWLLWFAGRLKIDRKILVLAACECAELALVYVPKQEKRPAEAIATTRAWCRGEATIAEVRAAAHAAHATYAAAAYAAAHAADAAARAAYAAYAAAHAADAAAHAARAADAADAAAYAAHAAASAAAAA